MSTLCGDHVGGTRTRRAQAEQSGSIFGNGGHARGIGDHGRHACCCHKGGRNGGDAPSRPLPGGTDAKPRS
jgi:hypothetical protein